MLALSFTGKVYFWGSDGRITKVVAPEEVKMKAKVEDVGALWNCGLSVCKTDGGAVYFWGFHFGKHVMEPRRTEFSTMDDVFASLDIPLMLNPVKFDLMERNLSEKMELAFDDAVSS